MDLIPPCVPLITTVTPPKVNVQIGEDVNIAVCPCGWRGLERDRGYRAARDATEHSGRRQYHTVFIRGTVEPAPIDGAQGQEQGR